MPRLVIDAIDVRVCRVSSRRQLVESVYSDTCLASVTYEILKELCGGARFDHAYGDSNSAYRANYNSQRE